MNKTVKKVFMLIALLLGIFLAWTLIFNDGGILKTAYNSVANGVNKQWAKTAGSGQTLLATWGSGANKTTTNGTGFDANTH